MKRVQSRIFSRLAKKKKFDIAITGLEGAGKTTIFRQLTESESKVASIKYKNMEITFWDIFGQSETIDTWHYCLQKARGVIFVVDAADGTHLEKAAEKLKNLMGCNELRKASLLVFANKQDLPNAMTSTQIADKLGLQNLKQHWHVQATVGLEIPDLSEGLDYLIDMLAQTSIPVCDVS